MSTISTANTHSPDHALSVNQLRSIAAAHLDQIGAAKDAIARQSTGTVHPEPPSDFDLNPGLYEELDGALKAQPAAVLIPIRTSPTLEIIFTERAQDLPSHAGQISFPGGKVDPTDKNASATALREAYEEINLNPDDAEPLGFLDPYQTRTGFLISPLVALIPPDFEPIPNPREVSAAFSVPLSFLLDSHNMQRHERIWRGRARYYYAIPYQDHYIWGATAGIIRNMRERLFAR